MAHIGSFTRTPNGYAGRLRTLSLNVQLSIVTADHSDAENAPDFRVHIGGSADGPEIGAGWKRSSEKVGDYVSLLIDDPAFTQPIRARLVKTDPKGSAFQLRWNRPSKSEERA
ncbi:MAG: DUF736 domain-containing protein [Methylovirgula sp.]